MEKGLIIEQLERKPKAFLKITLFRHEEATYKNEGDGLTPGGRAHALEIGKKIKEELLSNSDVFLLHSPSKRAKGTLDLITQGAGITEHPKQEIHQLRGSGIHDIEKNLKYHLGEDMPPDLTEAMNIFIEMYKADPEKFAKKYHSEPFYEEASDVVEPKSNSRKRLYRSLEYLIRWFEKKNDDNVPHIMAVSHYEVITHLLEDVFGIENLEKYNTPSFGEHVDLNIFSTDSPNKYKLEVVFGGDKKEVFFDRGKRAIVSQ